MVEEDADEGSEFDEILILVDVFDCSIIYCAAEIRTVVMLTKNMVDRVYNVMAQSCNCS